MNTRPVNVVTHLAVALHLVLAMTAAPLAADDLEGVLGTDASQWKLHQGRGAKRDETFIDAQGLRVLQTGAAGLRLLPPQPLPEDHAWVIVLRFAPSIERNASVTIDAGLRCNAEQASVPVTLGFTAYSDSNYSFGVNWSLPKGPDPDRPHGSYILQCLPENRLTWPDLIRRRAEHEHGAMPPRDRRWLTARFERAADEVRTYLDGRLLRRTAGATITAEGTPQLWLSEGVQLASVRTEPLPKRDPRFETVPLEHDLNSDNVGGKRLTLDAAADHTVTVGGVPFRLASPDEHGRDHVDVGRSWLKIGALEGGFAGMDRFIGRWMGAMERDPNRIQFRVPYDRYVKVHLLAAASGEPDTLSTLCVQFYRPTAGHPVTYTSPQVPTFRAKATSVQAITGKLADGTTGKLYDIVVDLAQDQLASLSDASLLEIELTGQVRVYRNYPDPCYPSMHAGGLPSGVQVYAVTLERPGVTFDCQPDTLAHVWTAPKQPSYTVKLHNSSAAAKHVTLRINTVSYDKSETTQGEAVADLTPGQSKDVTLPLQLKHYGHHDAQLAVNDGSGPRVQKFSLAYLHEETRERGHWETGRGMRFGFWDWNGAHVTLSGLPRLQLAKAVGIEGCMRAFADDKMPAEERAYLEANGFQTPWLTNHMNIGDKRLLGGMDWDGSKPKEMGEAIVKFIENLPSSKPSPINDPQYAIFWGEPSLGQVTYMSWPEYFGEPAYQMTESEQARFKKFNEQFIIGARAVKERWPNVKCLFPWGYTGFAIPFLRHSPEATELMDGPGIDMVLFERLPEMQLGQVTVQQQMWQLKQEWTKHSSKPWPHLTSTEGPCVSPSYYGTLTGEAEAENNVRAFLALAAYDVDQPMGIPSLTQCAGYWGESHYGAGLTRPLPTLEPKPVLSAFATMTRQLNRANFVKWVNTGSHTVFCLQFKHYKTGELLHVLWTIRGRRPVTLALAGGEKLQVIDGMDNPQSIQTTGSNATFTLTALPCFVRGLKGDAKITLGEPDHSDAQPGKFARKLASLGDGSWKISEEPDGYYENSNPDYIRKFPGKMTLRPESDGLAIHLEKQDKDRFVMPYYTTLVPAKPLVIPGQATHLGLWVSAQSDWGRVVYVVRDAKGERWTSVGKPREFNCDDTFCASQFCFDGRRYLTFELPASAPYDCFREAGTVWWGSSAATGGAGNNIVDLPLTLEKIIVERRTHVVYVNELLPASPADVVLGDLNAEYAAAADSTDEAVRLSRLRAPVPAAAPELANPIQRLREQGAIDAPPITKVSPPEHEYDGTRCDVFFDALPEATAVKYDVWVSCYEDGRGAVMLGKGWKKSGQLLTGLAPGTDFYLFLTFTDAQGKVSKPSPPFRINLHDMFPMK